MSQRDIESDAVESAQAPSGPPRCAGLTLAARRALSREERLALRRRARGYRLQAVALLMTLPVMVTSVVAATSLAGMTPDRLGPVGSAVWAAAFLLGLLVGLPVTLLVARDWYKRGSRLVQAMGNGEVLRFEGQINWHDWTDRSVAQLVRHNLLTLNDDAVCRLEVFSETHGVYSVNGTVPKRLLQVEVTRTASRPENPRELAVPASWYQTAPPRHLERRRQSDEEADELVAYANRFPKTEAQIRFVLVHLIVAGMAVGMGWHFRHVFGTFGLAVALTGALVYLVRALKLLWRARRLANLYLADAQLGWVLIALPQPGEEPRPGPMEFLPVSGQVWTIAGRPAGWRNRH